MQVSAALQRDLVLVGGGHSHALALRMLAMRPLAGLRVTLISPASHTPYSGMLPGLIAGHYSFEDAHIDLERLCQWAGVRFVCAEVTALDPVNRSVQVAGRPALTYDLLSLDIGSQPDIHSVPGAAQFATPVKPVASLWQRWRALEERVNASHTERPLHIALVGGGAGSVELALAMAHRLGDRAQISVWCGASQLLPGYRARTRQAVVDCMQAAGIALAVDARIERVEEHTLQTADQRSATFDELFWCTAAAAAPWVADSGLPVDAQGFLAINDRLHSTADARVFGAGDIATLISDPRPKAGVYAVRQAPVLAHNLRASLLGKPLRTFRPQRRFLSLLSLGDRRACAERGWFGASGAWVWRWKDHIDQAFMRKFSELPWSMGSASMGSAPREALPELSVGEDAMVCGGCGAKVGQDTLRTVLTDLAQQFPNHVASAGDDAVAVPATGDVGSHIVQSVDVLREIVSDYWLMGRIAANHALSDLYACGARPVSALAAVTLPFAREGVLQRDLQQLLAGAAHEFAQVDCVLNGGHSLQGSELQVGFTVNGVALAGDGQLLSKTGAQPGDQLILTKPLGTGVLFAAHMRGLADGRDVRSAIEVMLRSNSQAAVLARQHGATACTDVTGFGLLGHLLEMLGGEVSARILVQSLPLLDGAHEAVAAGVLGSMAPANRAAQLPAIDAQGGVNEVALELMFDAQTSGGLLIAVPAASASALLAALQLGGSSQSAIIGEITAPAGLVTLA